MEDVVPGVDTNKDANPSFDEGMSNLTDDDDPGHVSNEDPAPSDSLSRPTTPAADPARTPGDEVIVNPPTPKTRSGRQVRPNGRFITRPTTPPRGRRLPPRKRPAPGPDDGDDEPDIAPTSTKKRKTHSGDDLYTTVKPFQENGAPVSTYIPPGIRDNLTTW